MLDQTGWPGLWISFVFKQHDTSHEELVRAVTRAHAIKTMYRQLRFVTRYMHHKLTPKMVRPFVCVIHQLIWS